MDVEKRKMALAPKPGVGWPVLLLTLLPAMPALALECPVDRRAVPGMTPVHVFLQAPAGGEGHRGAPAFDPALSDISQPPGVYRETGPTP